jgi:FMN-dependent NADH-azoreductase
MNTILFIEASPRGKESASRAVADTLAARLSALYPSAKLVRHDLAADHPPHPILRSTPYRRVNEVGDGFKRRNTLEAEWCG